MSETVTCIKETALDYVGGGSDKVYIVRIHQHETPAGISYRTIGYYGRRGSKLAAAEKYSGTSLALANSAAAKLETEKLGKGYNSMAMPSGKLYTGLPAGIPVFGGAGVAGASAPAASSVAAAPVVVGIAPMLAETLAEDDLEEKLKDPNWVVQRKYDGERVPVYLRRSGITATNRKGHARPLAAAAEADLKKVLALPDFGDDRETVVDGEELPGGVYVIYDVVTLRDNDMRKMNFEERFSMLEMLFDGSHRGFLAPTAYTEEEKRAMLAQAQDENWEGLMFRHVNGEYIGGRTKLVLKYKLWQSATCRVLGVNTGRRSINIAVLDDKGDEVEIGNVTVPVNQDIPPLDALVEIRYLYVLSSLYQPVLLGVRTDKDEADLRSSLRQAPPEKLAPLAAAA